MTGQADEPAPGDLSGSVLPMFGSLSGNGAGPPVPPPTAPATAERLAAVEALLDGAHLLGLEVDTRYRVLAMTVEPGVDHAGADDGVDHRLQLLWHPVGRFAASLRERVEREDGSVAGVVRTFDVEQLPDVVAALDAPVLEAPLFGRPEPTDAEWGPTRSLDGRAQVGDGLTHRLRLDVVSGDGELHLGFVVAFDAVDVRDASGDDVEVDRTA